MYKAESAGMSRSILQESLCDLCAGPDCYLLAAILAVVSPAVVDNIQALTPAQLQLYRFTLGNIIKMPCST